MLPILHYKYTDDAKKLPLPRPICLPSSSRILQQSVTTSETQLTMAGKATRSGPSFNVTMSGHLDDRSRLGVNDTYKTESGYGTGKATKMIQVDNSSAAHCCLCAEEMNILTRLPDRIVPEDQTFSRRVTEHYRRCLETRFQVEEIKTPGDATAAECDEHTGGSVGSQSSISLRCEPSQSVLSTSTRGLPKEAVRCFARIRATRKTFRCFGLADVLKIKIAFSQRRHHSVMVHEDTDAAEVHPECGNSQISAENAAPSQK